MGTFWSTVSSPTLPPKNKNEIFVSIYYLLSLSEFCFKGYLVKFVGGGENTIPPSISKT